MLKRHRSRLKELPVAEAGITGTIKINGGLDCRSKITVDGDCSHEIKRSLLLGRKVMKNLDKYDFFFNKLDCF